MNHRTHHVVGYLRAYYAGRRISGPDAARVKADALELVPDLTAGELRSILAVVR